MLELNESIRVPSAYEFLTAETGVFEVISPAGDVLRVVCRPGQHMRVRHIKFSPEMRRADLIWQVKKISESPDSD